jgi:hypothetical protein
LPAIASGCNPPASILAKPILQRAFATPQVNPFAKAQREGKAEKQTDLI